MTCKPDAITGFAKLSGPIKQMDLDGISIKNYPLGIAFGPRNTVPTMIGNRIYESTDNTCTYRGNKYNLDNVKICSVMNEGYMIPGQKAPPVAELIISFKSKNTNEELNGILLCVPVYDSGFTSHAEYITQLLDSSPSCKPLKLYQNATYYHEEQPKKYETHYTNSLPKCISIACNNPKVLSYTYFPNTKFTPTPDLNGDLKTKGNCILFDSVPSIKRTTYAKDYKRYPISGTINHVPNNSCDITKVSKNGASTLESIFYSHKNDTSQTSFAYKSCFTSGDTSKTLYVIVFPNGIHVTSTVFQQLLIQLNGSLTPYNTSGTTNKTISVSSDYFRNRLEYFILPPRSSSRQFNTEQCPYYKTNQYKCMPFNQLKDLSNNYVIPGSKTLNTILDEQDEVTKDTTENYKLSSSSTDEKIAIIILVGGFIACGVFTVLAIKH